MYKPNTNAQTFTVISTILYDWSLHVHLRQDEIDEQIITTVKRKLSFKNMRHFYRFIYVYIIK